MAAATRQRRKMFVPPAQPITVVQPPPQFAHLEGAELKAALLADRSEKWYSARCAAEAGRSLDTFRPWVSTRYTYDEAVKAARAEAEATGQPARTVTRPTKKMMAVPDGYDSRSPWWWPGTARRWMIQEKLMDDRGVFIPHKPTGRPAGKANTVQRQNARPMQQVAVAVLNQFEGLVAGGMSRQDARTWLARNRCESEKQIDRRLTAGRKLRAENDALRLTDGMPAGEAGDRIRQARALLATDRRRRGNEDRLRDAVARRLGIDRAVVDRALDAPTVT